MKAIYKLKFDCGRQGKLTGVFVEDPERVKVLMENSIEVYFGEALGKHSEVYGPIGEVDIELVSTNEEAVKIFEEHGLQSGYNPFELTTVNWEHDVLNDDEYNVGELCDKLIELSCEQ